MNKVSKQVPCSLKRGRPYKRRLLRWYNRRSVVGFIPQNPSSSSCTSGSGRGWSSPPPGVQRRLECRVSWRWCCPGWKIGTVQRQGKGVVLPGHIQGVVTRESVWRPWHRRRWAPFGRGVRGRVSYRTIRALRALRDGGWTRSSLLEIGRRRPRGRDPSLPLHRWWRWRSGGNNSRRWRSTQYAVP